MSQVTRSASPWPLIGVIVAIAFVLRGPIVAVSPITGVIRHDLTFSAAQAGLLTSLPVLCFALLTPVASLLIARLDPDRATTLALVGVVAAIAVRSAGGVTPVVVGTILLGGFITIANVVVPVIIRRDGQPQRTRLTTALYAAALSFGSTIGALTSAPIADAVGWRPSLAAWALVAVVVFVVWVLFRRGAAFRPTPFDPRALGGATERAAVTSAVRRRDAWTTTILSVGFAGQAFAFYGITAWLPTIMADDLGYSRAAAGASSSVFQVAGVAGTLLVPLLARRWRLLPLVLVDGLLWLLVPLGMLVAPALWVVWYLVGGAAQGACLTLVIVAIVESARDDGHARRVSAITQGVGYGLGGSVAPTLMGALHDATSSWAGSLIAVMAALVVYAGLIGWSVTRAKGPPTEVLP